VRKPFPDLEFKRRALSDTRHGNQTRNDSTKPFNRSMNSASILHSAEAFHGQRSKGLSRRHLDEYAVSNIAHPSQLPDPTPLMEESSPVQPISPSPQAGGRYAFGLTGLILALLGLLLVVATPSITRIVNPPQKLGDAIAEAGDKLMEKVVDRVKGKRPIEKAQPPVPIKSYLHLAANTLAVLGAALGAVAWVRREDHRLAGCAMTIGALAIAFHYFVVAVFLAVIFLTLLLFLSS
jgi:hypothetical protein